MSKGLKKVVKGVAKVASLGAIGSGGWGSQAVGALSGGLVGDSSAIGGGLGGVLGGGQGMDNLSKTQLAIAKQQADQASAEAAEQARASAQSIQLQNDRAAQEALADSNKPVDTATPEVNLGGNADSATARRKKFNTSSVSAGSGGPAIRL